MKEVGGEEVDTSSYTQVRAVTFALKTFLRVEARDRRQKRASSLERH